MITHSALQHMARLKATHGIALDSTGVKFNTIMMLSQKPDLTSAEIAVLEHFVHSNNTVLKNTVYMGDQIIHPVSSNSTVYYKKVDGTYAERAPGTGPIRPAIPPGFAPLGKRRGRPPLDRSNTQVFVNKE